MDKTDIALGKILDKISELVATNAASGVEITLKALWWQAFSDAALAIGMLALACILAYTALITVGISRPTLIDPRYGLALKIISKVL